MGSTLKSPAKDYDINLSPKTWYNGSDTSAPIDKASLWWDDT